MKFIKILGIFYNGFMFIISIICIHSLYLFDLAFMKVSWVLLNKKILCGSKSELWFRFWYKTNVMWIIWFDLCIHLFIYLFDDYESTNLGLNPLVDWRIMEVLFLFLRSLNLWDRLWWVITCSLNVYEVVMILFLYP